MIRHLLLALMGLSLATACSAGVPVGSKAANFTTQGALAGKPFTLNLARELKKGPVVLYFFPKAFTKGCTLEARAFSEASKDFRAAGAQVIGLSGDTIDTLKRFSVEECRNAFPVAIATPKIIKAYDVGLPVKPGMSNRTSFVIARDGRVVMSYTDMDYKDHVARSLSAVRALAKE